MSITPINYLKETWEELTKVTWPTRTEVVKMSVTVLIVSSILAAFVGGLDVFLAEFMARLINIQF